MYSEHHYEVTLLFLREWCLGDQGCGFIGILSLLCLQFLHLYNDKPGLGQGLVRNTNTSMGRTINMYITRYHSIAACFLHTHKTTVLKFQSLSQIVNLFIGFLSTRQSWLFS